MIRFLKLRLGYHLKASLLSFSDFKDDSGSIRLLLAFFDFSLDSLKLKIFFGIFEILCGSEVEYFRLFDTLMLIGMDFK